MISSSEALAKISALVSVCETETVALREAFGRVLAGRATAARAQPPFDVSAMDGYAVAGQIAERGAQFNVIGESAAGQRYDGTVSSGQAVRIFTGAVLPKGANRVIIQEDVTRDKNVITLGKDLDPSLHIRPAGDDFQAGDAVIGPKRLHNADIALLASMNIAMPTVTRRPVVALVATGDELVMPGETPGDDQIIASNSLGLAAMLESEGAEVRILPLARDNVPALRTVFSLCDGVDLVITIGGASVGDHDLVHNAAGDLGLKINFHGVAMRPGKPLMAGLLNGTPLVGLPGNPVSSMVCGHVFLRPIVRYMQGLPLRELGRELARLDSALPANGVREHFMRARASLEYGQLTARVFERQDSALLSVMTKANALVVRPPRDSGKSAGDMVETIRL